MGKRLFYWELAGALFTAAMGTLLHFVYDWSGGWGAAAAFSAVNESTWEHMKLLFFPMFLFSMATQYDVIAIKSSGLSGCDGSQWLV